jgi:hypothetical protein
MKFMVMHKADAKSEAEVPPTQELIANVGKLLKGAMEGGMFIDAAGLRRSALRVRVSLADGERSVKQGPYQGEHELISECVMLKVDDMSDAIDWGTRLAKAAGREQLEVGTVTEPWDLGVAPKPEGKLPLHALALLKSDARSESGEAPGSALQQVVAEATTAGVLMAKHELLASAHGARLKGPKGARQVFDGPFTESKELVGGFMILEFPSKADAVAWASEYADVVGASEVDVREVR